MEPRDLTRLHVEALFTCDGDGRLVSANVAGGGLAPRFFLGRYAGGAQCWFRHDVEKELVGALGQLAESLDRGLPLEGDPEVHDRFIELLEEATPIDKVWAGPAFCFPAAGQEGSGTVVISPDTADPLKPYFEEWLPDVQPGVPFSAVLEGGRAVSVCCSVRVTPDAHEAGVATHPEYRGRGHGGRAVAAWARLVRSTGAAPLYSTSWSNAPSRSLARRLGLVQFGADLHIA